MTSSIQSGLNERVCVCAEPACEVQVHTALSERDLFTRQVGQALITLGNVFINVLPFSEHIDRNTGELLISLGRKLKGK